MWKFRKVYKETFQKKLFQKEKNGEKIQLEEKR